MRFFLSFCLLIFLSPSFGQFVDSGRISLPCEETNRSFLPGESVTYKVYYNWKALWVGAGEVNFSVNNSLLDNKHLLHLVGVGKTYRTYDWFFKVRDTYESYIDPATLLPVRFIRDVNEGGYTIYDRFDFDRLNKKILVEHEDWKTPRNQTLVDLKDCIHDVLSAIYYARNVDYSQLKPGDTFPIEVFLDGQLYDISIRFLGTERLKLKEGTFDCIKFSPTLIAGTIFQEGSDMTVWVTNDKNKIPVMVESPIIIGSIKAIIKDYKGLRNTPDGILK